MPNTPSLRDDPDTYIENSLTNQSLDPVLIGVIEELRGTAKNFGHHLVEVVPETPERTLAIRDLETSVMWAVKAICLNQAAAHDLLKSGS